MIIKNIIRCISKMKWNRTWWIYFLNTGISWSLNWRRLRIDQKIAFTHQKIDHEGSDIKRHFYIWMKILKSTTIFDTFFFFKSFHLHGQSIFHLQWKKAPEMNVPRSYFHKNSEITNQQHPRYKLTETFQFNHQL